MKMPTKNDDDMPCQETKLLKYGIIFTKGKNIHLGLTKAVERTCKSAK